MLKACLKKDDWYSEEDQQLWTGLRKGRQKALEELFKRHHLHLYNYGINLVLDREVVNDAIQNVFLTLWEKHERLSEAQSIKAYLLSSLRRSIFEMLERTTNRNKRSKKYLDNYNNHTFSIEHKLIQEEILEELTEKLQKALQELTPRQKEAIYLRFYNGLNNKEVSFIMDINYQCVSNLLFNAISRLRSSIDYQSKLK